MRFCLFALTTAVAVASAAAAAGAESETAGATSCEQYVDALLACEGITTTCTGELATLKASESEFKKTSELRVKEFEAAQASLEKKLKAAEDVSSGSASKLSELTTSLAAAKMIESTLKEAAKGMNNMHQECVSSKKQMETTYNAEKVKVQTCQKEVQSLQRSTDSSREAMAKLAKEVKALETANAALTQELTTVGSVIFSKEKALSLGSSLWTITKALAKNLQQRVYGIVGRDAVDQAQTYYRQGSSFVAEKSEPLISFASNVFDEHVSPKIVSPISRQTKSIFTPHCSTAKDFVSKGSAAVEAHVDNVVRRLSQIEPKVASIMPKTFEDRLYAFGFLGVCALLANAVISQVWAAVSCVLASVLALVFGKSCKKSSKTKKSSTATKTTKEATSASSTAASSRKSSPPATTTPAATLTAAGKKAAATAPKK